MKTRIISKLCIIGLIAILSGCKKDTQLEKVTTQPNTAYEKVKAWFEGQTNLAANKSTGNKDIRMGVPVWNKTEYCSENRLFITPIIVGEKNSNLSAPPVYKFLLINENNERAISSGYYLYLIPDKNHKGDILKIIGNHEKNLYEFCKTPNNFSGTIIKYDLDYNIVDAKYFERGQLINKVKKLVVKIDGEYTDMNSLPINSAVLACGQCLDYYLITYDEETGEIISIEYLYTECGQCPGGGGGESGGGGGEPPSCEQQNENFINQGFSISGPLTTVNVSNNGTIWIKNYNWMIYTASTWGLYSYERGTLEKKHYHPNIERWEFQSFDHLQISEVGTNIGGTRTYTDLGATINITPTHLSVWEQIDFSVTSKALCWILPPVTLAYNANKTFIAPNSIIILHPE